MKNKVLFSNAYALITIGSTMVLDGEKLQLGITYVILGLVLFGVEVYFNKKEKDDDKSNS